MPRTANSAGGASTQSWGRTAYESHITPRPQMGQALSIKIMSWVWDHSPYEGKILLIHLALADWAGDDGVCWPSQEKIAAKCRCSVETVRTTIKRLIDDDFITIVSESKGKGNSHRYKLLPKSFGGFTEPNPQMVGPNPQISTPLPPNPSPKNRYNHQEPSVEVEKAMCPYCKRRFQTSKPHNCAANNMLMR